MRLTSATLLCAALVLSWVYLAREPPTAKSKEGKTPAEARSRSGRRVQAPPVPLPELVRDADRIFIGEVAKVAMGESGGVLEGVRIETVTFQVAKVLKGEKVSTILQAASIGVFREKTGRLLIYLSPDSDVHLTQPIGIYSGYFEIKPDPDTSRKGEEVCVNLHGNEGLWGGRKTIVGDGPMWINALNREVTLLELAEAEKRYLTAFAREPAGTRPVPINLMIAATRALSGKSK